MNAETKLKPIMSIVPRSAGKRQQRIMAIFRFNHINYIYNLLLRHIHGHSQLLLLKNSVIVMLSFLFVTLGVLVSSAATNDDAFSRGVELNQAGQYTEAAAAFESSVSNRPSAGAFVNLGLAEWQRGHAGAAIIAWEQAQWIDPYNIKAKSNLEFAREVAQVDAPVLKWHEIASTWLPPNAWVWLASASLWLAIGIMVLPGIFSQRKANWHQFLAAAAFGIFLFSLACNYGVISRTHIGFALKKNVSLRLTPTRNGETICTLTPGEPLRSIRAHGRYCLVQTAGASGWLETNEFRLICPSH